MRSVPFPLEPGAHGKGVADLHRALEEIGVRITQSDVNRRTFGTSTERALSSFQMAHGLSATGTVDRDTAVRLNEVLQDRGALAEGERAPDALPPGVARVRGTVTHISGPALPRMVVRAIERGIFDERELGKVRTSDTGTFEIEYRLEAGRPVDLQLQVLDRKKACVARSAVFLRAPSDHRARLVVTDPDWPVPSEFEILGWRLEEVMESTDQDLDQLEGLSLAVAAGQAGVDVAATLALVTAQRLSHDTDIDAEILYGLIRAGGSDDPVRLFTSSHEEQRAAIAEQIELNHVHAKTARSLKSARKELEALRLHHLLAPGASDAILPSLAWILDLAGVSDDKDRQTAALQLTQNPDDPEAQWRALGRKGGLAEDQVRALQLTAQLCVLTHRCAPLIEVLLPEVLGAGAGIEHLATLSGADWRSKIEPLAPDRLPAEFKGEEDPVESYVISIQRALAVSFPATTLRHRIQDSDFEGAVHVRQLLLDQPQLDLLDPNLGGLLKDRPFDDPVRQQLEAFQRIWSLAPPPDRYPTAVALLSAGLGSAHAIASLGLPALLERVADRLGAEATEQLFDAATQRVALTGAHTLQVLGASPPARGPRLDGPDAYLFELLALLGRLPSDGATALEILAQRRPDLATLAPGDRSTIGYLELVDRVLGAHRADSPSEEAVYPWSLPVSQATDEADMWLGALGIARHQLLAVFHHELELPEATTFAIDAQRIGLSLLHAEIVVGETGGEPEGWGVESFRELRSLPVLLDRAELTRAELWALLQTETVNPSGKLEVEDGQISGMSKAYAGRLQRFLRLQRALGWPIRELDDAIQALGSKRLDRALLHKIAVLDQLRGELELPVATVLSWWTLPDGADEVFAALQGGGDPGEDPGAQQAKAALESFAQAAGASIGEVIALRDLVGIDPFDGRKVEDTVRAIRILGQMRDLGVGSDHLEIALTLQPAHEDEVIALLLRLGGRLDGLEGGRTAADALILEELLAWLDLEPEVLDLLTAHLSGDGKGLEPLHHKTLPGASEEQCSGRALRPARQLLLTLRKASRWIHDLSLPTDALGRILELGWLELGSLPTTSKASAPSEAWLALLEVLCLERSWPEGSPGVFTILEAAGRDPSALVEALAELPGWSRATVEALLDADHLALQPEQLRGPGAAAWLIRLEGCRAVLQGLGKIKLTSLWRDRSDPPEDWRATRPSAATVNQIARVVRRHTDAAPIEDRIQRRARTLAMDTTLAALRPDAPHLKTRQDLLEHLLIDVDGGSATPRIVEATAAVKRFIQRIALELEPGLQLSPGARAEWRSLQAEPAWRASRRAMLAPEGALDPDSLEARLRWLSTLPEPPTGETIALEAALGPPHLVVGPSTPGEPLQIPDSAIVETHIVTLETIEAVEARSEPGPPTVIVAQPVPRRATDQRPSALDWPTTLAHLGEWAQAWRTAREQLSTDHPEDAIPIYERLLQQTRALQPHPELAQAWWSAPTDPALALLLRPGVLRGALVGELVDLLHRLGDTRLDSDRYEAARYFQQASHVLRTVEERIELRPHELEPPRPFLELVVEPEVLSPERIHLEAYQPPPAGVAGPAVEIEGPPRVPGLLNAARWFTVPDSPWLDRQRRVAQRLEVVGNQLLPAP